MRSHRSAPVERESVRSDGGTCTVGNGFITDGVCDARGDVHAVPFLRLFWVVCKHERHFAGTVVSCLSVGFASPWLQNLQVYISDVFLSRLQTVECSLETYVCVCVCASQRHCKPEKLTKFKVDSNIKPNERLGYLSLITTGNM